MYKAKPATDLFTLAEEIQTMMFPGRFRQRLIFRESPGRVCLLSLDFDRELKFLDGVVLRKHAEPSSKTRNDFKIIPIP